MNSGPGHDDSDGWVMLSRGMWGALMAGLYSDDEAARDAVRHRLIAMAWPSWYEDLDTPGVLEARLEEAKNPPPVSWSGGL